MKNTAADLYAMEIWDSPLRRLARQVLKQRGIISELRRQRKKWLYGEATDTQSYFQETVRRLSPPKKVAGKARGKIK